MKMKLNRPQVVGGRTYGPGEIEVSGAVAKALKGEELPASAPQSSGSDGLPADFPYGEILAGSRFATLSAIRAASDEELLAVDGIGEARLKEIRKAAK
jgi:hypothetical protein